MSDIYEQQMRHIAKLEREYFAGLVSENERRRRYYYDDHDKTMDRLKELREVPEWRYKGMWSWEKTTFLKGWGQAINAAIETVGWHD